MIKQYNIETFGPFFYEITIVFILKQSLGSANIRVRLGYCSGIHFATLMHIIISEHFFCSSCTLKSHCYALKIVRPLFLPIKHQDQKEIKKRFLVSSLSKDCTDLEIFTWCKHSARTAQENDISPFLS